MAESASKWIHKWRRYPSSNSSKCYESDKNLRFVICRSAVAPSDSAEKNGNIGAQLVPKVRKSPKILWKIYFLYDFLGAKTCSFRAVFGLPVRNLTLLMSALNSDVQKKYIGAHLRSRP